MSIKHYQDCIVVYVRVNVSERMKSIIAAQLKEQHNISLIFFRPA